MLRSDINRALREAQAFMASFGYILPPFANWTPGEMQAGRGETANITRANLGWDLTDFGLGNIEKTGLLACRYRPWYSSAVRTAWPANSRSGSDR